MKRIDTSESESYWKFGIYGPSGTGKSSLGVTAPRPLILLSERQGLPAIKLAAKRLGVPVPPVLYMGSADDYRAVVRACHGDKSQPFAVVAGKEVVLELPADQWPQTLVTDSLTDACDLLLSELEQKSPRKKGRDGLPVRSKNQWGSLIEGCAGIIKALRDLPMHVVFLCLPREQTREDDDGNLIERKVAPKLATVGLSDTLAQAVNLLGITYRTTDKKGESVFGVAFQAQDGVMAKTCEPLNRREIPDIAGWIERLNGHAESAPRMPVAAEGMPVEQGDEEPDATPPTEPNEPAATEYQCSECGKYNVDGEGKICQLCEDALNA